MELFKTYKDAFTPVSIINQAEKNTQAILAYVEPKELGKILSTFTEDASNFFRAQVNTVEQITDIFKTQAEDLIKKNSKIVK